MNLFPQIQTPYYIYAPAYTHISSGARALHLLCHALNESGQKAYLVASDGWPSFASNPHLNTPELTPGHATFYAANKIEPIVVYPDMVMGNPLNAKKAVRWLLAPAGLYGGSSSFPDTDIIYGYTTAIAKASGSDKVLLVPTFDKNIFYAPVPDRARERKGICFYSHKYDKIHGNTIPDFTIGYTRLEGSPKEVADILRKSAICFVFEMSEIIVLAQMCGCHATLVRSDYFNDIPEDWDMPLYGVSWRDEGEYLQEPEGNIREAIDNLHIKFEEQLKKFIEETQAL